MDPGRKQCKGGSKHDDPLGEEIVLSWAPMGVYFHTAERPKG
jgi:hypothetical protein